MDVSSPAACPPPTFGSPAREDRCDRAPVTPPQEERLMKVAQIKGTCRCDAQGFEEYALPDHAVGAVDTTRTPLWSVMCASCGAPGHVHVAELTGPEPVAPLQDAELIELMWEREELEAQIRLEELTRPYPWPSLIERRDALDCVVELNELEVAMGRLELRGRSAMPAQLRQRQELRIQARALLTEPAF